VSILKPSASILARAGLALGMVLATFGWGAAQGDQQIPVSFTAAQADQGQAAYRQNCQDCHGTTLDNGEFGGPPLKGGYFVGHWGTASVAALYGYLSAAMPPDRPGQLSPQTYANLTAFILSNNGYPAREKELPLDPDAQQKMTLKK
jgi:mono/diheme cytochrome c family protein